MCIDEKHSNELCLIKKKLGVVFKYLTLKNYDVTKSLEKFKQKMYLI